MKCLYPCLVLAFWILLVIVGAYLSAQNRNAQPTYYNEIHIHTDFAIYIDGEIVDFTDPEYTSGEEVARDGFLHLHERGGDVLHIHARKQTFAMFLRSLGMQLTGGCFSKRDGSSFCREDGLQMFVNRKNYVHAFDSYTPKDLDRILLTTQQDEILLETELDSITDKACVQSGICPERGEALESCDTHGLGECPLPPKIEPLAPYMYTPNR